MWPAPLRISGVGATLAEVYGWEARPRSIDPALSACAFICSTACSVSAAAAEGPACPLVAAAQASTSSGLGQNTCSGAQHVAAGSHAVSAATDSSVGRTGSPAASHIRSCRGSAPSAGQPAHAADTAVIRTLKALARARRRSVDIVPFGPVRAFQGDHPTGYLRSSAPSAPLIGETRAWPCTPRLQHACACSLP